MTVKKVVPVLIALSALFGLSSFAAGAPSSERTVGASVAKKKAACKAKRLKAKKRHLGKKARRCRKSNATAPPASSGGPAGPGVPFPPKPLVNIGISPTSFDFGSLEAPGTAEKEFVVTNIGNWITGNLEPSIVKATGDSAITFEVKSSTCSQPLSPEEQCQVTVEMTAESAGMGSAELLIHEETITSTTALLAGSAS
jgi:hypothetical protein